MARRKNANAAASKQNSIDNGQNSVNRNNNNLKSTKSINKSTRQSGSSNISSNSTTTSSSSSGSQTPKKNVTENKKYFVLNQWRTIFGCICLAVASWFGYLGYLETRVNTPFDNQKMVEKIGVDDPDKYWGSYRPGVYFGMKTREPHSLVMGLMWYFPHRLGPGGEGIKHWCELNDKLLKYGWTHHDGKNFGSQEIYDSNFLLETSFIKVSKNKHGGDWTARISVKNLRENSTEPISLIWYSALDEKTNGQIWSAATEKLAPGIFGEISGLGEFRLNFHKHDGKIVHKSFLSTVAPSLQYLKETVRSYLRLVNIGEGRKVISLPGEALTSQDGERLKANFIATQITVQAPFTLDISYQSVSSYSIDKNIPIPIVGQQYTNILNEMIKKFEDNFEAKFKLSSKGYSKEEVKFSKAALSNMIGGIGYFYGSSRVQSIYTKEPVPYWKSSLYTAVPSRSFFPRGFLWDEGFHGLLISEWDIDIELDIMSHWFDLMNVEGWIPREQILGVEALAKVPEEFVTQKNTNANPPTFFLTLKKLLTKQRVELSKGNRLTILERIYPRLQAWFSWYNTTQKGDIMGTYRWRGRDPITIRELNPKTLTSGLDDYPRASHPSDKERHIDLRCWVAFASGVMAELSTVLGRDDIRYWETYSYLTDNQLLNELHLSPYTETYSDYGLHSDAVMLKRAQLTTNDQIKQYQQPEMIRLTKKQPEYRFVDTTYGYVSLFPFLLEILEPQSPHLGKILKDIRNPEILWTNYGLRSLSKLSPVYMKRNTEHDPPYWRGQIWININYLALKALYYYGQQPSPYNEEAKKIYVELRENIVKNIYKEYKRSGYIWEQYNDKDGEGSGCHPFTGWSALVTLIMAEKY